jgi:hypothetical protein
VLQSVLEVPSVPGWWMVKVRVQASVLNTWMLIVVPLSLASSGNAITKMRSKDFFNDYSSLVVECPLIVVHRCFGDQAASNRFMQSGVITH